MVSPAPKRQPPVTLVDQQFPGGSLKAKYPGSRDFRGWEFQGCNFEAADLARLDFTEASFTGCKMTGSSLRGSCIAETHWKGVQAPKADLVSCDAAAAKFVASNC